MDKQSIDAFFNQLATDNPTPRTELQYRNPFQLLVAVILSAQATDVSVNKVTGKLFATVNTPQAMLALGETRLRDAIRTIGLFNSKAANIIATCKLLLDNFDGEVPRQREALESLPGVGRKTANVVLNTAFGESTMAVDTHIFRVANRTGLAPGKTPLAVERGLLEVIPASYLRDAHHWLILLGRYTCKARAPLCGQCAVKRFCDFPDKRDEPR